MATLSFGPFVMDLETRRVRRGGTDLKLRPRAFHALRVLLLNSGHHVDYDRMLAEAWDGTVVSPHTIGVTIGEVRKTLGEYAALTPDRIRSSLQRWLGRPSVTVILEPGVGAELAIWR